MTEETLTQTPDTEPTLDGETPKHPFERGLELYEEKASYDEIIPLFEQGLTIAPRDSIGYTCLAWLHYLRHEADDVNKSLAYAQKAVRLDPNNAQAHFNQVLAMLSNNVSGVRQEFQRAMSKLNTVEERQEVLNNLNDAIERRPDLAAASKVLNWMQDS